MAAPLLRWDKLLDLIREEDATHLIARLRCGECKDCRQLGDDILLEVVRCAEHTRAADINHQHHCQLALLFVDLDMRFAGACRNIPIDIAHIVANAILAHLGKGHTSPLECRMVLSCENLIRQTSRLDFDFSDALQDIVLGLLHPAKELSVKVQ